MVIPLIASSVGTLNSNPFFEIALPVKTRRLLRASGFIPVILFLPDCT